MQQRLQTRQGWQFWLIIAFSIGVISGIGLVALLKPGKHPSPTSSSAQAEIHLLFLVDRLDTAQPKLIGIWYFSLLPKPRKLYINLIYPRVDGKFSQVVDMFSLDKDKRVREDLWQWLDQFFELGNREYLITDRYGLTLMLMPLEPFQIQGHETDALNAVGSIIYPWNDPVASAKSQSALLAALCARLMNPPLHLNFEAISSAMQPPFAYIHDDGDFVEYLTEIFKSYPTCATWQEQGTQ